MIKFYYKCPLCKKRLQNKKKIKKFYTCLKCNKIRFWDGKHAGLVFCPDNQYELHFAFNEKICYLYLYKIDRRPYTTIKEFDLLENDYELFYNDPIKFYNKLKLLIELE